MKEACMCYMAMEDATSKQRRESKEMAYSNHPVLGKGLKSTSVWHWQEEEKKLIRLYQKIFNRVSG